MTSAFDRSRDDEDFDDEIADYGDSDSDEDEPTVKCANCGFDMLEIVLECPRCGEYASKESHRQSSQPRWVLLTAFLCLGTILYLWLWLV